MSRETELRPNGAAAQPHHILSHGLDRVFLTATGLAVFNPFPTLPPSEGGRVLNASGKPL